MAIIIILSAVYNNKFSTVQKENAEDYFGFSKAFALVEANYENKSILVIKVIFNLTAIKGNATDVTVFPLQGNVRLENSPYFDRINQGQTVPVQVTYDRPVLTRRVEGGFPLRFRVTCPQAEGTVTVYVTRFSLSPYPY